MTSHAKVCSCRIADQETDALCRGARSLPVGLGQGTECDRFLTEEPIRRLQIGPDFNLTRSRGIRRQSELDGRLNRPPGSANIAQLTQTKLRLSPFRDIQNQRRHGTHPCLKELLVTVSLRSKRWPPPLLGGAA